MIRNMARASCLVLILALIIFAALILVRDHRTVVLLQVTATPGPASFPTEIAQSVVTYDELIEVQKEVLETSKWGVTITLSVITALSAIGGIVGAITGLTVYKRISDAAKRADETALLTRNIEKRSKSTQREIEVHTAQVSRLRQELDNTKQEVNTVNINLIGTKDALDELRRVAKRDLENLRKSMLLVQVEEYSVNLFGDDPDAKWTAKQVLKAMTDPGYIAFVRRRSVRALGRYLQEESDPEVVAHLETIAREDPALSVRRSAQEALDNL